MNFSVLGSKISQNNHHKLAKNNFEPSIILTTREKVHTNQLLTCGYLGTIIHSYNMIKHRIFRTRILRLYSNDIFASMRPFWWSCSFDKIIVRWSLRFHKITICWRSCSLDDTVVLNNLFNILINITRISHLKFSYAASIFL